MTVSGGFDEAEYIELFLAEARENLEMLNTAVVALESDPTDRPNVDSIFRVAHSVKGMAATMGFDPVASLTHAMEDVFAVLRERSTGISTDAVDVLFDCLDMLSAMISEIEAGGTTTSDPEPMISRLQGLVRTPRDATPDPEKIAELPPDTEPIGPEAAESPAEQTIELQPADEPAIAAEPELVAPKPPEPLDPEPTAELEPAKPTSDLVDAAVREAHTRATVRVEAHRLDTLLHMIGELVVRRNSVEQLADETGNAGLQSAVSDLTRASQAVQDMVMRVRMVPIDTAFARLPRLVRDLSQQLGKRVDLRLEGRDTELDRTAVDALVEPLMHLVRNSIDHGIEQPAKRLARGKPETGILRISARHEGGEVVISITDDGKGIDHTAVINKAVERNLIPADQANRIDADQAVEFLFMPGFSTADQVSDISGRGVGMDAVRSAVRGFGGDVRVQTKLGEGTTTEVRMPLTLAILPALVVEAAGDSYAIQLDRVHRTFKVDEVNMTTVAGQPVAVFSDGAMPVVSLAQMFDRNIDYPTNNRFMVTVRSADRQLALLVDDMIGRRELVTRPVPERVRKDSPVSGGAVLASGEIAFIVDCEELVRRVLTEPLTTTT